MSSNMVSEIICRTCKNKCCHYLHLGEEAAPDKSYANILLDIANISFIDALPNHICGECATEVRRVYAFVQQAQRVNQELLENLRMDCLQEAPIDVPIGSDDVKIKTEHDSDTEVQLKMPEWSADATDVNIKTNVEDAEFDPMTVISLKMNSDMSSGNRSSDEENQVLALRRRKMIKKPAPAPSVNPIQTKKQRTTKTADGQGNKIYSCETCGHTFTWKKSLRRHSVIHSKDFKEIACEYCDRKFSRKDKYTEHMKMHITQINQDSLRKADPGTWIFAEHLCSKTIFKLIQCKLCEMRFESSKELQEHLATHAQLSTLEQVTKEHTVLQHFKPTPNDELELQQLKEKIAADIEQQAFDKYYCILNDHGYEMRLSDSDRDEPEHMEKYECELCWQSFMRKYQLIAHAKETHTKDNLPHKCTQCQVKFVNKSMYHSHMRSNCRNKQKQHQCSKCSAKFMWPENLTQHSCLHPTAGNTANEPEKKVSVRPPLSRCSICTKTFLWEKDLLRHLENHEAVKVDSNLCKPNGCKYIECMICLSKHAKIVDLRNHLGTHQQQLQLGQCQRSVNEISVQLYPELEPMSEQALSERIAADLAAKDWARFYSITNEMGYELSISASETDTDDDDDTDDEDDVALSMLKTTALEYSCEICKIGYKRKYQAFAHQAQTHKWTEAPHVCAKCKTRFVCKKLLIWHQRHNCRNPMKKHQCKRCPKRFMWQKNMRMHMQLAHDKELDNIEKKEEVSAKPKPKGRKRKTPANVANTQPQVLSFHRDINLSIDCHWCPRKFSRKHHLYLHLQKHGVTPEQYETADCFIRATTNANGTKQILCKLCNSNFNSIAELRQHFAMIHAKLNGVALSQYCITNQLGFEMLLDDSETEAETVENFDFEMAAFKYGCDICGCTTRRKYQMAQHQMEVHQYEMLPFKCEKCVYSTVCRDLLYHHVLTQCRSEKQFNCSICDCKFMWKENVQTHLQLVHVIDQNSGGTAKTEANANGDDAAADASKAATERQMFQCKFCQCTYSRKQRLSAHIRIKHGSIAANVKQESTNEAEAQNAASSSGQAAPKDAVVKKHLCSFCGLAFISTSVLNIHLRRHTGEKPFKCDQCDMAFIRSSDLRCHKRKHTGERPFKCTVCDKAFITLYKLQVHFRIHSGTRPYKCTYCDKSFYQSNDLTVHVRVHTGERPYQCNLCDKSFKRSSGYTDHMRRHMNKCAYACIECNETFASHAILTSHRMSHGHMSYS